MTKTIRSRAALIAALAATLALGGAAHAQVSKCVTGKQKCVTGQLTGLLNCYSKDAKVPDAAKLATCLTKVQTKYDGGAFPEKGCFAKLELKPPCLTNLDSDSIDIQVDGTAGEIRALLDPSAPPSTLNACAAGKFKCTANLVKALLGCEQKQNKLADPIKYPACIAKAQLKWDGGPEPAKGCFGKIEAKLPNDCMATNDLDDIKNQVDASLNAMNVALACGNGTVGAGENCDDGDRTGGDGCSAVCKTEICGNNFVDVNETCDDGNTSNNDDCPADCVEDACTPLSGTVRTATIQWNAPSAVAGITVLLDYPEGKVNLPGNGGSIPPGVLVGFPASTSEQHNDLGNQGHALREVVTKATAITPRPGQLFQVKFEDCQGATAPTPGDFTCTVLQAFATDGTTPVAGATCTVSSVL